MRVMSARERWRQCGGGDGDGPIGGGGDVTDGGAMADAIEWRSLQDVGAHPPQTHTQQRKSVCKL